MSDFATKLLPMVKKTLRQADNEFDDEIGSYIDTAATDLQEAGILYTFFATSRPGWEIDNQILQACRWYALSVFGLYNPDMEKYAKAYASLKATLASQQRYTANGEFENTYDEGYAAGKKDGYDKGYAQGNSDGLTAGRAEGYDKGVTDGYQNGYAKGDAEGQAKGRTEGETIGFENALSKRTDLVVDVNGTYEPQGESTGFKSVKVAVPERLPILQEKTATENGEVIPDDGYDGLSKVTVNVQANSENKLAQVVDKTVTEITAEDLQGATTIGKYAFIDCSKLVSVHIPEGVKGTGYYSFQNCTSLESVIVPSTVTELSVGTFRSCSSLKEVSINSGIKVTIINSQFLYGASSLEHFDIPESVTRIKDWAFAQCNLKEITLPSKVKYIETLAFNGNTNLTTVICKPKVPPELDSKAFANCNNLSKVLVPIGCYDVYSNATNWSAHADLMIEEALVELNNEGVAHITLGRNTVPDEAITVSLCKEDGSVYLTDSATVVSDNEYALNFEDLYGGVVGSGLTLYAVAVFNYNGQEYSFRSEIVTFN